jgi:hypothetical protein
MKLTILLTLLLSVGASAQSIGYLEDAGTLQASKMMSITIRSVVSECRASWIENFTLTGHSLPVTEVKYVLPFDTVSDVTVEPNPTYDLWQVTIYGDLKSQEISRAGNPGVVKKLTAHSIVVEDKAAATHLQGAFKEAIKICAR